MIVDNSPKMHNSFEKCFPEQNDRSSGRDTRIVLWFTSHPSAADFILADAGNACPTNYVKITSNKQCKFAHQKQNSAVHQAGE